MGLQLLWDLVPCHSSIRLYMAEGVPVKAFVSAHK